MKKLLSTAAIAATAVLLAGCSAPAATSAAPAPKPVEVTDLAGLIEAAKAEGALRVYGQIPEAEMLELTSGFEEEYGIKVEALRLGGNTLSSRFDSETEAGTASGEALLTVDVEFLAKAKAAGAVQGFSETGVRDLLDGFPEEAVLDEFDAPIAQVVEVGFIYNTSKVEAGEVPSSWSDLNDPRWKGKYCSVDPAASVNTAHFFWLWREKAGEGALEDFGANVGRWYPNIVAMNEAVAVGECELGLNSAKFFVESAKATGAQVEFAEAPTRVPPITSVAVATAAEHPHAARLFLHYVLSEDANSVLSGPTKGATGPWDPARLPVGDDVPAPDEFQKVRDSTPELTRLLGL